MNLDDSASLRQRMEAWYGPSDVADVAPVPPTIDMPRALRSWYEVAGRWADAINPSDSTKVMSPEQLYVEDGRLVFMTEYIGDWAWATDTVGDDPAVYDRSDDDADWRFLSPGLGEFLHLFWLFNAVTSAPAVAVKHLARPKDLSSVQSGMHHIATVNWRCPLEVLKFYEADGTLAYIASDAGSPSAFINLGASTRSANPVFESIAGQSWYRYQRRPAVADG
ncbi:hypothetical protein ACQEVZ_01440 [Dactylosporangium sp. CA-152071]|uniref:hypothetical protein n=1 Tax=Dactylosporangium sp. CA-152071 TaxID=3239933 RepID=UPI003D92EEB2